MESLNIAFFTDSYLPSVDGVVTSILNFKKELERRGHRVYVFASGDARARTRYSNRRTFMYPGVEFKPYPQYNVALFPYNSVFKLRELHADIVHSQTPMMMGLSGMMGAKLLGLPLVGSFHTLVTNKPIVDAYYPKNKQLKKFTSDYVQKYVKFFYKKCNIVIAPSNSIHTLLRRYGVRSTTVVPNSIDLSVFNSRVNGHPTRVQLRLRDNDKMVLYIGRLSKEKRLDVLLKAARILSRKNPHVKFVIGGTGPAEQYYRDYAARLGLRNVTFLGFVENKALPKVYAASDAFCIASTFETQGIVSLEAMAMGKPVVGADYLATSEIIRNGRNGEKFPAGDYTGCAEKIEKVINNPKAYRKQAIKTAVEFSTEKVTDKLLDTYNLVLSKQAI